MSNGRSSFTDRQKFIIFSLTDGLCFYCDKQLTFGNLSPGATSIGRGGWQIEHLKSFSNNGSNSLVNLVAACVDCNQARNNSYQKQGEHYHKDFMGETRGEIRCAAFTQDGKKCRCKVQQSGKNIYCWQHESYHGLLFSFDDYVVDGGYVRLK